MHPAALQAIAAMFVGIVCMPSLRIKGAYEVAVYAGVCDVTVCERRV